MIWMAITVYCMRCHKEFEVVDTVGDGPFLCKPCAS